MRTYTLGVGWKRIYTLGGGWKNYCGIIEKEGEGPKGQGDDERMKNQGFVWKSMLVRYNWEERESKVRWEGGE